MSRTRYLHPGEWQTTLVDLHCRGLSDAAVARELTRCHPPYTFTRRMVLHHRTALLLDEDTPTLAEARHQAQRLYQLSRGLGHLLPRYDPRERALTDPTDHYELTPRECDILLLLLEAGRPLRRREIARQ